MQKMLKRTNYDRQNSTLENQGTHLDFAHLRFRLVKMAT